jgi:hypothetical protein
MRESHAPLSERAKSSSLRDRGREASGLVLAHSVQAKQTHVRQTSVAELGDVRFFKNGEMIPRPVHLERYARGKS